MSLSSYFYSHGQTPFGPLDNAAATGSQCVTIKGTKGECFHETRQNQGRLLHGEVFAATTPSTRRKRQKCPSIGRSNGSTRIGVGPFDPLLLALGTGICISIAIDIGRMIVVFLWTRPPDPSIGAKVEWLWKVLGVPLNQPNGNRNVAFGRNDKTALDLQGFL